MVLKDELETLRRNCLADFDSLDEFVQHTQAMWDFLSALQSQPVSEETKQTFLYRNRRTGEEKTLSQICDLYARKYEKHYLLALSFQQIVALFEVHFFEFLRLLLLADPAHRLSKSKKMEVDLILSVTDYPSILELIVERELNELKYKKVHDWFVFLDKHVHLEIPSEDEIGRTAEIKACRDLLVHNAGTVNKVYLEKAEQWARYHEGDRVEIEPLYHQQTFNLLRNVLADVITRTNEKILHT